MILLKAAWWIASAPVRFVFWLALLADEGGDGDAEMGRKRLLGRHHPTAHLPRHSR